MSRRTRGLGPLSPRGTAAQRFLRSRGRADGLDSLGELFAALARGAREHDLGDESLHMAEEVVRLAQYIGDTERRALAVALLASMVSARRGSTRLPLGGGANGPLGKLVASIVAAAELDVRPGDVVRDIDNLSHGLTFDRLIGKAGEYRPLIVHDDCLYAQRWLAYEQALVVRIRSRIRPPAPATPALETALAEVASSAAFALSAEQLAAVRLAVTAPLSIVTGGPGTGKTAIVVSILRVAARLGVPADQIAVAGPTGKAVNRLATAIRAGLEHACGSHQIDADLLAECPEPATVHRLLGYLPQSRAFRQHENNPLRAELVVVDEASMIDLALMDRLLRALRPSARLVLVGDAEQLPSVDAGAVLRDLASALPAQTALLETSFRMDPSDPAGREILTAAQRVNQGKSPLTRARGKAVRLHDTAGVPGAAQAFVDAWFAEHIAGDAELKELGAREYRADSGRIVPDDQAAIATMLDRYAARRLLTVTRRQATGADALNRRMHEQVLRGASLERAELYPGEPILMRTNDYQRGLFNGDQGLIARVREPGQGQHFRAVFPGPDGARVFPLEPLRTHVELAFAMTVHMSQGSELDHIAVILPGRDVPLLTREMLYTAITRARRSVVLVGSDALLRVAASRTVERFSGIAAALR
ncbi:MAG TPA: exodeoxyribonuclease V subunit alpha [Kofleriaceae bacterium]|nr:exodeoxyribonuclease V subunit alpha [Kofleriaceae bacterium]